jgi:hypothetical protein
MSKLQCRTEPGREMFLCCENKMPAKTVMENDQMGATSIYEHEP